MRKEISDLPSVAAAKAFLNNHRNDRAKNGARRSELRNIIDTATTELRQLDRIENDERDIIFKIGQLAASE